MNGREKKDARALLRPLTFEEEPQRGDLVVISSFQDRPVSCGLAIDASSYVTVANGHLKLEKIDSACCVMKFVG